MYFLNWNLSNNRSRNNIILRTLIISSKNQSIYLRSYFKFTFIHIVQNPHNNIRQNRVLPNMYICIIIHICRQVYISFTWELPSFEPSLAFVAKGSVKHRLSHTTLSKACADPGDCAAIVHVRQTHRMLTKQTKNRLKAEVITKEVETVRVSCLLT